MALCPLEQKGADWSGEDKTGNIQDSQGEVARLLKNLKERDKNKKRKHSMNILDALNNNKMY